MRPVGQMATHAETLGLAPQPVNGFVSNPCDQGRRLAAGLVLGDNPHVDISSNIAGRSRMLVIVPAHNEAASLPDVLADLAKHAPQADIAVVDDGSIDNTAAVARAAGATVLPLPCNLGVGGAMQTGYMYAADSGYDVAVQFDGDGQHRANLIAQLAGPALTGQADLVVGSRLLGGLKFRFHPLRFLGNRMLAMLISAIGHRKVTDPTSGFRAAGRRAMRFFAAHYPQTYLGDTAEALVWAERAGLKITEIPVRMRQRTAGESAIRNLKGFWLTMRIVLAILVDCLESRIVLDEDQQEGRQ